MAAICSSGSRALLSNVESFLLPTQKAGHRKHGGAFELRIAGDHGVVTDGVQNVSPCLRHCSVFWARSDASRDPHILASCKLTCKARAPSCRGDGKCNTSKLQIARGFLKRGESFRKIPRSQVSREDFHVDRDSQSHRDAFKEAIFELEFMVREPAEVLAGLREKLSTKDLELVLAYFAQEGRDSWCALEVFDWMQRENRMGNETHQIMMRIMFDWIMKLVEKEQPVDQVKSLLQDMHCVGLKPEFHIMQSIIGTYWEKGRKAEALSFVKEMLETDVGTDEEDPVVFLILRMVKTGDQKQALDLIYHLRESDFKLKVSAFTVALVAAVVEQEQLTTTRRKLRDFERRGLIEKLDSGDWESIHSYQETLHGKAEEIAGWALEEGVPEAISLVNERLLAMYCIAGKALSAEKSLWGMKLAGREPPWEMYNVVLGMCGYQNEREAVFRILRRMEDSGKPPGKKSYTIVMGGFIKGGHIQGAADVMHLMLGKNIYPDSNVMMAVLRSLQRAELVGSYLKLCQGLAQAGLIEPCLLYFYIDALKLCIIRSL